MRKYMVVAQKTILYEAIVEAENREDAEDISYLMDEGDVGWEVVDEYWTVDDIILPIEDI